MALWFCCYGLDDECGCFIVTYTRRRAKSIFHRWRVSNSTNYGSYRDVRVYRIKDVPIINKTVFKEDYPELEALRNRYLNDETIELEGGLPVGTGEN